MDFQCGKLPHVFDGRTILFSSYMDPEFQAPTRFDFDKGRARFPFEEWHAPSWKADVIASQANQLLRFGRIDQRLPRWALWILLVIVLGSILSSLMLDRSTALAIPYKAGHHDPLQAADRHAQAC